MTESGFDCAVAVLQAAGAVTSPINSAGISEATFFQFTSFTSCQACGWPEVTTSEGPAIPESCQGHGEIDVHLIASRVCSAGDECVPFCAQASEMISGVDKNGDEWVAPDELPALWRAMGLGIPPFDGLLDCIHALEGCVDQTRPGLSLDGAYALGFSFYMDSFTCGACRQP
eukprot:CAMPEP_0204350176 /NCGR_PEP_ID=MMETSP0469-20131031/30118_1 /ASSEMBLY_ACC=CAM_ASM_000384 /TAXON_ID=2969 /ORGANISM="Oxyrrhis marina" /LENGTH=171 /DNA_ID=CAMNT_0051336485 /DNA_START=13 /DNA_END=528 /DNA_ORIENTATION=+